MPSPTDFPACGRVIDVRGDTVVFVPAGTSYEIHLKPEGGAYAGPIGKPIEATIHAVARKVWTVLSGGRFIVPIFGPPKIVQGRIRYLDDRQIVVAAGGAFVIDLPAAPAAMDLANGPIEEGTLVNVTLLPGATFAQRAPSHAAAVAAT